MSQPPRPAKCPICGKAPVAEFRPFCSKRCRHVDLGKWLDERYAIPAEEGPDGEAGVPEDGE